MPGLKNVKVISAIVDEEGLEGAKQIKETAVPSKPAIYFY